MKDRKVRVFSLVLAIPLFVAAFWIFSAEAGATDDPAGKLFQALNWVSESPDRAWARVSLGDVYVSLGRHEDAIKAYKTALRFEPDNAFAMNGMGYAWLGLGKPEKALQFFVDAAAADPSKADLKSLGYTWMALGKNAEALDTFNSVLAKEPENTEILNAMGQASYSMGDFAGAVKYFEMAISVDPLKGDYASLGYSYSALGMENRAKESYSEGVRLRPRDQESLNALGFSLFSRGRLEEAREIFYESLDIDPDNVYVLNGLGYVYSAGKDHEKAIGFFEKAARADQSQADYVTIGYEYAALKRHEEAAAAFRRAISRDPSSAAEAWYGLGYTLIAMGSNVEAMDAFRRSYMLMPEPRTLNSLGYAYMVVRNYPNAIEAFNRALGIDPEDAQARFNLALAMLDLDRRAEARKYYGELQKIDEELAAELKSIMDEAWK